MPAPSISGTTINNGLIGGSWAGGSGLVLTYSVPTNASTWPTYSAGEEPTDPMFAALNATQADAFIAAMEVFDSIVGATFNLVADNTIGEIRAAFTNEPDAWGYAYLPFTNSTPNTDSYVGDIWISSQNVGTDVEFIAGSYDLEALMHEIGHALGLKHSFEGASVIPAEYDNTRYTIMSYTAHTDVYVKSFSEDESSIYAHADGAYAITPMVLDIYALHSLYGADSSTNAGATSYTFNAADAYLATIYDAGGTDTWDLSAQTRQSIVDLRPGSYSSINYYSKEAQIEAAVATHGEWARSFITSWIDQANTWTWSNNIAIAIGTIIENVDFGSGNDSAIGNDAANTLNGNNGNDTLDGGNGADTLNGGAGVDTLIGGAGDDNLYVDNASDIVTEFSNKGLDTVFSSITWTLGNHLENLALIGGAAVNATGNGLANELTGNGAVNTLNGGNGDDTLNGGGGADILLGGRDNDLYIVGAGDTVTEFSNKGTDTVSSAITWALANHIENLTLTGSANINGTGNGLANTIYGNAGNNTLDGKAAGDTLIGGLGNDIYLVDTNADSVVENVDEGADRVLAYASYTMAANIERLDLMGSGNLNAAGNALANTIVGNSGNNVINGGLGNDTLAGGAGGDVFLFNTAPSASNRDRITDFDPAADAIRLDDAIFTALSTGVLAASAFVTGSTALDANDRIIYNSATGALIYDANGNAAGGAVQFATLNTGLAVTNLDFIVV